MSATEAPPRDQWGTKAGFILAAAGSAIGLGNIWRYPAVAYENGGGAFLIPYFIALLTAGIPILILEYGLGHRARAAAPLTFAGISRRWESLGWWQIAVSFFITTYYLVVLGWALAYIWFSVGTRWGDDPAAFFLEDYLGVSTGFWAIGGIQWKVLLSVLIAWVVVYAILRRGVPKGIELASKVLIPLLVLMMVVIVLRGVTLPGAAAGLDVLLTPDFGALTDAGVWVAAYGQVFFSLSIGFSIMIAYASYLKRRTDLPNSAVVVGLANSGFEFLAALGVFAVLGFFATQQGVAVDEVVQQGVTLAFIAFPQIISELPALSSLFGVLFFGALTIAGLTSAVSILECGIAGIREKFGLSRAAAVNWLCGICALVSVLYTTRGGLYYLDTVDHFLNNYGLVLAGLAEVIFVAWIARQIQPLRAHINQYAYLRVGNWWVVALTVITPILLGVVTVFNLYEEFRTRYEDYPLSGLLVVGWGVVLLALLVAFVMPYVRREAMRPTEGSTG